MPLPEDEQRQLQEIERALYEDDPKFARLIAPAIRGCAMSSYSCRSCSGS